MAVNPKRTGAQSESLSHTEYPREKYLFFRNEPFGMRAFSWFIPEDGFDLVGSQGGNPGFKIVPSAMGDDECKPFSGPFTGPLLNLTYELFVDGGVLWVPFPATVYATWPDISNRNQGKIAYSIEPWSGETTSNYRGLSFTRMLQNNQIVEVSPLVRRVLCAAPNAGLELPTGIIVQTGQEPVNLGARTVRMRFLTGIDPSVTHAPVVFYYGI